jgi:Antidote-toxin recognition MazE, bacterial antitoxin
MNATSTVIGSNTTKSKGIAKVFFINKVSATVIIPVDIARKYGLNQTSHVTVEETPDGILIKRLALDRGD